MMIYDFKDLPNTESIVGKKAIGLKKFIDMNFNVPKGFVISRMAFLKLIDVNDAHREYNMLINKLLEGKSELILERIRRMIQELSIPNDFSEELARQYHKLCYEPSQVQSAYELIQNTIVAVRASDEDRKLDTFTNVKDRQELIKAIKSCWQSYFLESTYDKKNSLAIIIQKMQKTDKTGWIELSANASIKAFWGQAGFMAKFNPDTIILDLNSLSVLSKSKGKQEFAFVLENANYLQKVIPVDYLHRMVLDDNEVRELLSVIQQIRHKIGVCSFEYGFHQKKLYLLNIRLPEIEEIEEMPRKNARENPAAQMEDVIIEDEEDEPLIDNLLPQNSTYQESEDSILDLYEKEQEGLVNDSGKSATVSADAQSIIDNEDFIRPVVEEDASENSSFAKEEMIQEIIEEIPHEEVPDLAETFGYEDDRNDNKPIQSNMDKDSDRDILAIIDKVIGRFKRINPSLSDLLDLLEEEIKKELK